MKNNFLEHYPHTKEGAKLQLTDEQKQFCKVVYKRDGKGGLLFHELWNPSIDYEMEYAILPLQSIYKGISSTEYSIGTKFANIEGSSKDPNKTNDSWIKLLQKNLTDYPCTTCCAEENKIYQSDSEDVELPDFKCNNIIVGGHVLIPATHSAAVTKGSEVNLLPICNAHNTKKGTGKNYYMKLRVKMKTIVLKGYLE